jgi:hypothetical protein
VRTFSALVQGVLAGAVIPVRVIHRMFFTSGTYAVSDGLDDVVWNNGAGNLTYTGFGPSLGLQLPATQASGKTPAATITLSGADPNVLGSFFAETYRAQPVESAWLVTDPATGLPAEEVLINSGLADFAQLDEGAVDPADPSKSTVSTLSLAVVPKTVGLTRAGQRIACDLDQKLYRDANDGFFKDTNNISAAEINWGVAGANSPASAAPGGMAFMGGGANALSGINLDPLGLL